MTNSQRGTLTFEAAGKTHSFKMSTNAMVRYQDMAGETLLDGVRALEDAPGDIKRIRRLFFVGLCQDASAIEDTAGDLIDEIGLAEASRLIGEGVRAAFPKPPAEAEEPAVIETTDEPPVAGNAPARKATKAA